MSCSEISTAASDPARAQLSLKHSSSLERRQSGARRERLTPRQFLDKYSLPRVVRVVADDAAQLGPLAEPLLLYRQYRSAKVQARSVAGGKARGPALVIPDSYQGWFSLLTPKGQLVAQCYTSMQQLIAARVTRFLTKTEIAAYKLNDSKGEAATHDSSVRKRLQYAKTSVAAGQVLKLLAVFEDVGDKRLSLPLLGRAHAATKRYAQCLGARNQTVFVPLGCTGQFFAVALGGAREAHQAPLYQLAQLLRDHRLPVKAHLVAGPLPAPLPVGFTGSLLLEGCQEEDVILACTLPQPQLLEMDADSRFFLSRPLFHHEFESRLFKSPLLQTALAFCRDRGDFWRRQIKVTHYVLPSQHDKKPEKASKPKTKARRSTKKSSSFTYTPSQQRPPDADALPAADDLPYGRVADALEENIYAEICEGKDLYLQDLYYVQLQSGSDGTFSGTTSSSNPDYDTVC
ncbi:uncharacterized protein B4 [Periplaneta americana]|uniref:uncharacterized protein B4 n=1 Tax=Periplaneta americana TaxID=6978 RepID=UPI0037E8427F